MQINVGINLAQDDTLKGTPDELAAKVLKAVGGDESKDYCTINVMQAPPQPGAAGTLPEPVMPPTPPGPMP